LITCLKIQHENNVRLILHVLRLTAPGEIPAIFRADFYLAKWKDAKPDDLMDSKLRCVFELPAELEKPVSLTSSKGGLTAAKADGVLNVGKPLSAALDDNEARKLLEENKKLHAEMQKLREENRRLGVSMGSGTQIISKEIPTASFPSLIVVIAAIFLGFFLGKFIL
uniref:VAMP (vesicle-associated membrane protein)-associated protein A, like n=1 Tax=Eptatretus burgeri TaxID=7764 RepID=A0A8C4RCR4_EPTBU